LVPSVHGIYRGLKLSAIRFINAARVDPEVLKAISLCLVAAKEQLLEAFLFSASVVHHVLKCDFVIFLSPGMR
jgi:hypothetical protein